MRKIEICFLTFVGAISTHAAEENLPCINKNTEQKIQLSTFNEDPRGLYQEKTQTILSEIQISKDVAVNPVIKENMEERIANRWKPEAPEFTNRTEAGIRLGQELFQKYGHKLNNALILGCVRGGLEVADAVTQELRRLKLSVKLDIIVCRKISHPKNKEFGIGALGENGEVYINLSNIVDLNSPLMQAHITEERKELERRVVAYRRGHPFPDVNEKTVIIVDDGMASGGTVEAALRTVQWYSNNTALIIIAQPVSTRKSEEKFITRTQLPHENIHISFYAQPSPGQLWDIDDNFKDYGEVLDKKVLTILDAEIDYRLFQ